MQKEGSASGRLEAIRPSLYMKKSKTLGWIVSTKKKKKRGRATGSEGRKVRG